MSKRLTQIVREAKKQLGLTHPRAHRASSPRLYAVDTFVGVQHVQAHSAHEAQQHVLLGGKHLAVKSVKRAKTPATAGPARPHPGARAVTPPPVPMSPQLPAFGGSHTHRNRGVPQGMHVGAGPFYMPPPAFDSFPNPAGVGDIEVGPGEAVVNQAPPKAARGGRRPKKQ